MDAMDVDNAKEFAEMAKKILEMMPEKVRVFIDMKHVAKQLNHRKVITISSWGVLYICR